MIRSILVATPIAELAFGTIGLLTLTAGPGHATTITPLPGPPAALIAGAAVVAGIVIARAWRRK